MALTAFDFKLLQDMLMVKKWRFGMEVSLGIRVMIHMC
jgi:hypothetical protein